jgi:hypothetical protein
MKRFLSFLLTSHILLLTLLVFPVFSQQRWERNYGGPGEDEGYSVQQTTDGGYIVAGFTNSFGNGNHDIYLIKTNAFGDTLWTRTYGGAGWDEGWSVQQTQEGGYIIAGYTYSFGAGSDDVYLIKTDSSGDTLWTKTYGGTSNDAGYFVQQTQDTGYIVAGSTMSFGNAYQVYLIKTNASGDTLWTRIYGGTGVEEVHSVQQISDGGYIIAGCSNSFGDSNQVYLIKTNASGDTLWTRTYGGPKDDIGFSVQQTSDTGYIIVGTYDFYGQSRVYLIKTNPSGDTLWTRTYGWGTNEKGFSARQTSDGGYIVAGYTIYPGVHVYLIKTNVSGDTLWTREYGGMDYNLGYSVQQTQDGGYIIAGFTHSYGNGDQVYLIKTDAYGSSGVEENSPGRIKPLTSNLSFSVVPNPFTSFASVPGHSSDRFALYDILGRKLGVYPGARIGEGLSAGVYFLKSDDKEGKPLRIVKVR